MKVSELKELLKYVPDHADDVEIKAYDSYGVYYTDIIIWYDEEENKFNIGVGDSE